MALKFSVAPAAITVTSGKEVLAATSGMTLKLSGLRRVLFNLDDYPGAWSLANWDGAEATGFFRRDGGEQGIELVPNTTYAFKIGSVVVERFQVDTNERVTLIDGRGALKVSGEAKNKLVLSTLPVAIYPELGSLGPKADVTWMLAGLLPPDGRPGYKGPMVLRLAQGATYRMNLAGVPLAGTPSSGTTTASVTTSSIGASGENAAHQNRPFEFQTGKGCNMQSQSLKIGPAVVHVVPFLAACRN